MFTIGVMSDNLPLDGFKFERWFSDANAAGGRRKRFGYYVTSEPFDEPEGWHLIDSGRHVLEEARALGVANGHFTIIEADDVA